MPRVRLLGDPMDLCFNHDARFTRWIVANGLLAEPFVVIDIGVQGGENPRWHLLGNRLVVHGFDAIEEVIRDLRKGNAHNGGSRHYHWIEGGSEGGGRDFFFRVDDPCSSSLYQPGGDRHSVGGKRWRARRVRGRELDAL